MQIKATPSNQPALLFGETSRTYRELAEQVAAKIDMLEARDCRGKKVVLDLPDSFTLIEWVQANWRMKNAVAVLDQRLTAAEKEARIVQMAPELLIRADAQLVPKTFYGGFAAEVPCLIEPFVIDNCPQKTDDSLADAALVLFSSGSSGLPKEIVRTYASLEQELRDYAQEQGTPGAHSRVFCLVPVSHSFGLISAVAHTLAQGGLLVFPERLTARELLETVIRRQITHIYGVAFHYQLMVNEWSKHYGSWDPGLKLISSGGIVAGELLGSYASRIGLPIGQQYGMSEAGYIALNASGLPEGSVGKPRPTLGAEVMEDGELALRLGRSPYREPRDSWQEEQGVQGVLLTQDLVALDENGQLYIRSRKNDQVSVGGLKVTLSEIEQTVRAHTHVEDCCVISYEHPSAGTVIECVIVWNERGTVSAHLMKEWLQSRIAAYKIPKKFRTVHQIPTSPAGKVLKGELMKESLYELNGSN